MVFILLQNTVINSLKRVSDAFVSSNFTGDFHTLTAVCRSFCKRKYKLNMMSGRRVKMGLNLMKGGGGFFPNVSSTVR